MSKDTIYREDAIEVVKKWFEVIKLNPDILIDSIISIPSADRPQGWIPCSERLPNVKDYVSDMVIWCTDKSIVGVGWYYGSTKSWVTIDDTFMSIVGEVIAWMPLPKPWKGADDEV